MSKLGIKAIPSTSYDAADLTAAYDLVDATGLPNACFMLKFVNDSDATIIVSYNEVDDHDVILPDSTAILTNPTTPVPAGSGSAFAKGTKVWVRGTAGSGNLYVIGYYNAPYSN